MSENPINGQPLIQYEELIEKNTHLEVGNEITKTKENSLKFNVVINASNSLS